MLIQLFFLVGIGVFGLFFFLLLKSRNLDLWIVEYGIKSVFNRNRVDISRPVHIYFTLVDHFEPFHNASREQALQRVRQWCSRYPNIARKFKDSEGRHPKHCIFYPEETYDPEVLDALSKIYKSGFFDVEIHLHHDQDNAASFREKLERFKKVLHDRHGLLRRDATTGEIIYGFIHGNWSLDNSRRDGQFCGVNNELIILKETGCYADFTLPSAPSDTQTSKINSIYYALDDPIRPKSHDEGKDLRCGGAPWGDLLLIQGPLALNWHSRKLGFIPRIENGEISSGNGATIDRLNYWIRHAPAVMGAPNERFIKLYTHGCDSEKEIDYLLNDGLFNLYCLMDENFNDGTNFILHYVSCYEMYQEIKAIEGWIM